MMIGQFGGGEPQPQPQAGMPGGGGGDVEMVPLQAPDGSTRVVPAAKAPMYQQRWAAIQQGQMDGPRSSYGGPR